MREKIRIRRKIFHNLLSEATYGMRNGGEREVCGYLYGRDGLYLDYRMVGNVAKRDDEFEIGIIDQLKSIFYRMGERYRDEIIFHTHFKSKKLSTKDVFGLPKGRIYCVIFKHDLFFYRLEQDGSAVRIVKLDYELAGVK